MPTLRLLTNVEITPESRPTLMARASRTVAEILWTVGKCWRDRWTDPGMVAEDKLPAAPSRRIRSRRPDRSPMRGAGQQNQTRTDSLST
jgi:hypothetical protein